MSTNNDYNTNSPGPGPNSPGPQPSQMGDWIDIVSWIVDIGLIFAVWPLGIVLTIMKSRGKDVVGNIMRSLFGEQSQSAPKNTVRSSFGQTETRTTSSRAAAGQTYQYSYSRTASSRTGAAQQQAAQQQAAQQQTRQEAGTEQPEKGVRRADTGATVREVFGWIIGIFGLIITFGSLVGTSSLWGVLTSIAIALGGGAMILSGRQAKKKEAAFRRCLTVSGNKGIVRLEPLAKTLGISVEEIEKQVSEMIDRGYYGERAYLDHARLLLVIEPEQMRDVYRAEEQARTMAAEQKQQQEEEERRAARTEYERLVDQIRQADIDIEDEAMSEKIRLMQSFTEAIFQEVEKHPEKKSQIERFMNYYLPTTLKLLESYARIEEQGVSGENTAKAKADIEHIADTLVEGYRKQLDTLYRTEAADIAGDVSVIESMMRRDGLAGDSDFRPFKQFVEPGAAKKTAAAAETAKPAEQESSTEAVGQVMGGH